MNTAINTVANTNNELYIVTGAAGNLGSAIVRSLVSRKLPVRAFVLRGEEAAKHLPKEAEVIEGDVTDLHFSRKPVRRSSRAHFCLLHPLRCHGLREYAGGG